MIFQIHPQPSSRQTAWGEGIRVDVTKIYKKETWIKGSGEVSARVDQPRGRPRGNVKIR